MSDTPEDDVASVGNAAGLIWEYLNANGASSVTKLAKEIPVARDLVMQGLGWLAREDKLQITRTARGKLISLK